MDFDLIAGAVSRERWNYGRNTYIEEPIPQIGNLEFSCNVCSPEKCLKKIKED